MIRGSHRAAVLAYVVAVCCCCWTPPATAQVATLDWTAPRGCPDTAYVAQRLAALHSETARRDLRVGARIQQLGRARYALKLVLRASDYHAERRLASSSCAGVADAAIWLIAVALDPTLQARSEAALPMSAAAVPTPPAGVDVAATQAVGSADTSRSPTPEGSEQSPSPAVGSVSDESQRRGSRTTDTAPSSPPAASVNGERQPASSHATDSAPAPTTAVAMPAPVASAIAFSRPARSAPWRVDWARPRWWRVGVFGGVWSVGLPAPQPSVGARLGVGFGVLYAELRAAAELARGRRLADSTEARFATQDVGLAVCGQWGDRVRAGPCATATVLRSVGSARAQADANDQAVPWGAAGVSLELAWKALERCEIMVEAGVQLPLSARPRFTVEGLGEVAVAAPVNVYARLGFGFRSSDKGREQ